MSTNILASQPGPVVRWQPNTILIADSTMLPKIYHLRQNKTPHYNHSPTKVKGIVEESDWAKHREKRRRLDPPVRASPKRLQGAGQKEILSLCLL